MMIFTIKNKLKEIAEAIRKVKGTSDTICANDFAKEIENLAYVDNGNITGVVNKIDINAPSISVADDGIITSTIEHSKGYVDENTKSSTYQMPTQASQTITPSTSDQVISKGKYLTGEQTIKGDSNLKSEYILRGTYDQKLVSIFGVQGSLDTVRKFNNYIGGSNYYALEVVNVARSYHLAKMNGICKFRYSQNRGLFTNGDITDEEGRCWLDCSTYQNLIVRGIDFEHSPFNTFKGQPNVTFANSGLAQDIVAQLCEQSEYAWADIYLDRQTHNKLCSLGREGLYSIRRASELAEYYYAQGRTVYEFEISPTSIPEGLMPGDLIFRSRTDAAEYQKSRFKGISHVGLVARDTTKFYECTGYKDERITETLFCSNLSDKLSEISLIVRPNYNPIVVPTTPMNINLLPLYSFDSCAVSSSVAINGVTFAPLVEGGFTVQRTATSDSHTTFYLYKSSNPIVLEAGTYQLSGTPIHPNVDAAGATLMWGLSVKNADTGTGLTDINSQTVWDRGQGSTFELTEQINAYAYFFVSKSLTDTSVFTVVPKLIRVG